MGSPILQPVAALVLWSFVMWAWLYATRIPAIRAANRPMDPAMSAADLNAFIPPQVRWKADNYNHLMEQPTLFYATALGLALAGQGDGLNLWLAWAYVGLRVVHSLVQALANIILLRFAVFMVASLALLAMAIHLAIAVFRVHAI
ncbi:MAG: MAPEG family protein [Phenylobacterium sp.]|uniref:MAPEG family protein n=1 Tax=Phenylobacterium sp. TaxID=1871053 RepID=UPI001A636337|nr:MAPEG family protein [Phenylobacterium sp.]MBL8553355.1 MAPEG family protein [Phenylobacterium sp.]